MKRLAPLFVAVGMALALTAGTASAQSASLEMTAHPDRAVLGEPVTFTITKTNTLPSDLAWSVRDILPESVEFVSATSSQGTCALLLEGSNVVQCDLGTILSGESATMDITVIPTIPGEITNYASDRGESLASASVTVVTVPEDPETTLR